MLNEISLCRVWSNVRENRSELINLAVLHGADVRAFWEDPQGSQRLHEMEGFYGDLARVTEVFQRHRFTRWIYEMRHHRILFLSAPEQKEALFELLPELMAIAEGNLKLTFRSVREERLDPLAREIYVHEAERSPASAVDTEPVEGWGFLFPWSPERRDAVLAAREELLESLKHLAGIWEHKTGRRTTPERMLGQHQLLQAAGYPRVVSKVPTNGDLEYCWIYRADGEPDLVLSLYRVRGPGAPSRYLVAALGAQVEMKSAEVSYV